MKESTSKTMAYIGIVMSVIFIGFAVLFAVSPPEGFPVLKENNLLVAFCILMYGLFRLYRAIRQLKGNGPGMGA